MAPEPRFELDHRHVLRCVGRWPNNSPYVSVWFRQSPHSEKYVASGPVGTTKRERLKLATFLRRSLEAVTGKKVVLEDRDA